MQMNVKPIPTLERGSTRSARSPRRSSTHDILPNERKLCGMAGDFDQGGAGRRSRSARIDQGQR